MLLPYFKINNILLIYKKPKPIISDTQLNTKAEKHP